MSYFEKTLRKFKENPYSVKYKDIGYILIHLGFSKRYGKGSHVKFSLKNPHIDCIIPVHDNDCKKIYKKEVAKILAKNNLI